MSREIDPSDLVGKRIGFLTVEAFVGSSPYRPRDPHKQPKRNRSVYSYRCICGCGNTKIITRTNLITQNTESCGCLKKRLGAANPTWDGFGALSRRFFNAIRNHAHKRGLVFDLSIQEAWLIFEQQGQCCALTGWPLVMTAHKGKYKEKTASLDRIDSGKGYMIGNVQWVHKDVNRSKWVHSTERFIEICKAVYERSLSVTV